ncbi:LacI family DNA-binding transcriptional regulator [Micromonospora sp. WMMD812]|uniref:LacI family DNA-binding transcriptional regulator n=1 Tax=Micromonospora sp. WMMD812 TaxID=3015152 RepID=UPI00248CD1E2|nr:LacI family DNA-binding transcriptional regulator [Micromonospora sp. WMMD812]WBB67759.1 LacI family DNA-binding transcriptional regulator [Micromonospora sp. WMMD812]
MHQQPAARAAVMSDVARLAGVSHQTVSRVLNNHPSVRQETRERVLRAVHQLNYRPNALARGLAARRSKVIGVVSFDTILYGPAATLLGIERAARAAGYGINIVTLERLDRSGVASAIDTLTAQSVAGVAVIAPLVSAAVAVHGLPSGVPAVLVEPGGDGELPSVSVDQVAGARLAVEHLLTLGHETVLHIAGPRDWLEAGDRIEGWRSALEGAGRRVPPVITGDWSPRAGYEIGRSLAERRDVTAVFCANDHQALGLLRALHQRGVRVPEDVSVVGFDDIPEAEYFTPPLTTVRQDFDEVGRRCVAALLDLLDGPAEGPRPSPVEPTLVVRASSGGRPA